MSMYNNSAERVEAMFDCVMPKDRSDIPFYPQLITWAGRVAGVTQAEMIRDNQVFHQALKATYDKFGYPDVTINAPLADVIFGEGLPARYPGKELPDDVQFQFVETQNIDDEDYQFILKKGWNSWHTKYLGRIQNPPIGMVKTILRLIKLGKDVNKQCDFVQSLGMVPISGMVLYPLFDALSLIRSFEMFIMDLYDEPDMIKEILEKNTPDLIASNIKNAKSLQIKRMHLYAMRSDADVLSPELFDEFAYPYLKQMVLGFRDAGYRTVLHCDSNWLPMLDRFMDLPKASVHFEFDGKTDMFKAAEILDGWHSFRGDVGAYMLSYGTPDQVREYSEKLIEEIGMKTPGFMFGTGCEVPLSTKPECYQALCDSILDCRK